VTSIWSQRLLDAVLFVFAAVLLVVLYSPLALSLVYSLIPVENGILDWAHPSVGPYLRMWDDPLIASAVRTTLLVGSVSVILAVILGVACALFVTSRLAVHTWLIEALVFMPFLLPPIVTGLSLLIYFDAVGIPRGTWTIICGHTLFVLAVIYKLVSDRLRALPRSLFEAAADLGGNGVQVFTIIVWPLIQPVVITAAILAFALSFDETLITAFLAGTNMTLPVRLWAMMRVGFSPSINALVTIVIMASAAIAVIVSARIRREQSEQ